MLLCRDLLGTEKEFNSTTVYDIALKLPQREAEVRLQTLFSELPDGTNGAGNESKLISYPPTLTMEREYAIEPARLRFSVCTEHHP